MKNVFLIITILLGFFIICKASSHTDTLCNYDSFNVYWGKSDINKKIFEINVEHLSNGIFSLKVATSETVLNSKIIIKGS